MSERLSAALVGTWKGFGTWSKSISWKLSKETLVKEVLGGKVIRVSCSAGFGGLPCFGVFEQETKKEAISNLPKMC